MAMAENHSEAGNALFKKQLNERQRTLEDLQQTQDSLKKNLTNVEKAKQSKMAMAFYLLGELIDECIYDVLFEAHRDIKQAQSVCQICQTRCRSYVNRTGCDVFGKSYTINNLPSYECVHCQKMIAASRYAPHLEKCLGLAGRQSSRVANRRLGSSPASSADDMSTNELEYYNERKKKKTSSSLVNGVSRVKNLKSLGDDGI